MMRDRIVRERMVVDRDHGEARERGEAARPGSFTVERGIKKDGGGRLLA